MHNDKIKEPARLPVSSVILFLALLLAGYFFSGCISIGTYDRMMARSFENGKLNMAQSCYAVLQSSSVTTEYMERMLGTYVFQETARRVEEERKTTRNGK